VLLLNLTRSIYNFTFQTTNLASTKFWNHKL